MAGTYITNTGDFNLSVTSALISVVAPGATFILDGTMSPDGSTITGSVERSVTCNSFSAIPSSIVGEFHRRMYNNSNEVHRKLHILIIQSGADLHVGEGTRPRPPFFTCKKIFRALYLPLCQYLLKNQFMYRSNVCATVKIQFANRLLYSIIPTLHSVAMLPRVFGPPIRKFWICP